MAVMRPWWDFSGISNNKKEYKMEWKTDINFDRLGQDEDSEKKGS